MTNQNKPISTDNYFGGCPQCGQGGYVNIRRVHFGVCDEHQVYWLIGSNLFSCWRDEDQTVWDKNAQMLENFTEVKPILPLFENHDGANEESATANSDWGGTH